MALSTTIKNGLNRALRPLNIQVDSWTAIAREKDRINRLIDAGKLDEPRYQLLPGMADFDPAPLAAAYERYGADLERLKRPSGSETGYNIDNPYFSPPDCDALYLILRSRKPGRVLEIGSGHSTRVTRQAIIDGKLDTKFIAIDPYPRADIEGLTDEFQQCRLEDIPDFGKRFPLEPGDVLFVDSSHEAFVGNDVAEIFCRIIPALPQGVIVHVHDIFLPYEYPHRFVTAHSDWGEQYLVHTLLWGGDSEIIWPGHYLEREREDLHDALPFLKQGTAQSFWFVV